MSNRLQSSSVSAISGAGISSNFGQKKSTPMDGQPHNLGADPIQFSMDMINHAPPPPERFTESHQRKVMIEPLRLKPETMLALGILALAGFVIFLKVTK